MKALWFILLSLGCTTLRAEDLPQVVAVAKDEVTRASMSGCSLKCAFCWTVTSTKKGEDKATRVLALNDGKASSSWKDESGGVGTKLTFHFPTGLPAEYDGKIPVYGLDLINGDFGSPETWQTLARLKKARMYYNDKPVCDLVFPDSHAWERVHFENILVHSGDTMTLEILETYPGSSSATLAISEIVLQGAHQNGLIHGQVAGTNQTAPATLSAPAASTGQ